MDTAVTTGFLAEVNEKADPTQVLQRIGYATDKIQPLGNSIKAFCPLHKDTRFRSLVIDGHKFKCTIKTCSGYSGGTLVDLYAIFRKLDPLSAAAEMVGALDLAIDPSWNSKVAASLLEEAERAFVRHEHTEAEQAAQKALTFQPDNAEARLLLANVYMERNEASMACDQFLTVADNYLNANAFEDADRTLERASELFPNSEDLLFLKIRSAEMQGRPDHVIQLLEDVARTREQAGRAIDNLGVFEQLLQIRPEDADLRIRLGEICEMRRDIKRACREWEKAATLLIQQQRGSEAMPVIKRILRFEPGMNRLRIMLADQLMIEGEYPEARDHIFEVVNAQIEEQDFVAAAATAKKWLDVEPESIETHEALARVYQEQMLSNEAAGELRIVADLIAKEGDLSRSLEYLFRIKFLLPEDLDLRRHIIDQLKETGQPQRAAFELQDISEFFFSRGNEQEGEQALQEAASISDDADFKLQIASNLKERGRQDAAMQLYMAVATEADEQGNYQASINCYDELLRIDPQNIDLRIARAGVLWKSDRREAARTTFDLAKGLLSSGNPGLAGQCLRTASEHGVEDPQLAIALFQLCMQADAAGAAFRLYSASIPLLRNSDQGGALQLAAYALSVQPDAEVVLRDVAQLCGDVGRASDSARAYLSLSEISQARGDYVTALQNIELAIAAEPSQPDFIKHKVALLEKQDPEQARQAHVEYLRSLRQLRGPEELVPEYESYVSSNPGDSTARTEFAEILVQCGRKDKAKEQLLAVLDEAEGLGEQERALQIRERLLDLEPENARLRMDIAAACNHAGDIQRALYLFCAAADQFLSSSDFAGAAEAAHAAEAISPDEPETIARIARAERGLQNMTAFEKALERLLELGQPAMMVDWLRETTTQALHENRPKDAEERVRRWMELLPNDPEPVEQAALMYRLQQRTQRAVEMYTNAASLARAHGDLERSVLCLRQALEVDDESVAVRQQLWQILLENDREDEAIIEMQQLADVLIERRSYKDAATLLSRILEYRTNSADTLERLASLVYEYEGFAKAMPYYRKLLALRKQSAIPADVVKDYEKVLRLEGVNMELRVEYAEYLEEAGERTAAKNQLLQIGQIYRDELNDPVRAIQFFGRATVIAPTPEDARIFEEVASLHLAVNVPEFAVEALREAVRLYELLEEPGRAIAALERLVSIPGAHVYDYSLLGALLIKAGRREPAIEAYRQAVAMAISSESGNKDELRALCERLIDLDPLNFDCAFTLIDTLPVEEIPERSMELGRRFGSAGKLEDQQAILERAKLACPRNAAVRMELALVRKAEGQAKQLEEELLDISRIAAATRDVETSRRILTEAADLQLSPEMTLEVAPLHLLCGDSDRAVSCYCSAAEGLAEAGKISEAADALKAALGIDPSGVPASQVAVLMRKSKGAEEIRPIALQFLDSALLARSRTRALVVGTALLECSSSEDGRNLLRRIGERAGAAFAVAIGGAYADWLMDKHGGDAAISITQFLTSIAPNSPDAWWLAAQFHRKLGEKEAAAEASLKAARLFSEAGAVTEEETCYREALEEFPDDDAVLETLAFFYEREQRAAEALDMMKRLAGLAQKGNDYSAAAQWLQRAVKLAPDDQDSREKLVEYLIHSGRAEIAVEHLFELARVYSKMSMRDKAMAAYERVLVLEGNSEEAVTHLLDLAFQSEDTNRISRYSHMLADLKAESGGIKQACQVLKALLDKDPDNIAALEKLANLSQRGQDDKNYCLALHALGHKYAKRGDYAQAIVQFEKVLERRPADQELLQMLVDCYKAEGDIIKAADYGERLLDLARAQHDYDRVRQAALAILSVDDKRATVRRDLGDAMAAARQMTDAIVEWTQASEQFQADRDFASAAECLRRVSEASPENVAALRRYAELLISAGNSEVARDAYCRLADTYAATGEFNSAEAVMIRLLQIDPDDAQAHRKALDLYRHSGHSDAALAEILWLAQHQIQSRNYNEAEHLVQQGLEIDAGNLQLQHMRIEVVRKLARPDEVQFRLRELAQRYLQQGELQDAADTLEQVLQLDSELLDIRKELTTVYAKLGQEHRAVEEYLITVSTLLRRLEFEEARELADSALQQFPDNLSLRSRLADAFGGSGQGEIAARYYSVCASMAHAIANEDEQIRFLKLAVDMRPRWPEGLKQLAEACSTAGKPKDASEALSRLQEVYVEQKKFAEAAVVLRRQIGLMPKDPEPRRKLVDLYTRTGDKENRIAELQDFANLLLSRGETDEVVEVYRQLVSLRPDDIVFLQRFTELFSQVGNELEILDDYMRLADAYTRKGQFLEATRTFEKVLAIDRRKTDVREKFIEFLQSHGQKSRAVTEMVRLSELYMKSGNHAASLRTLTNAHELDPQNVDVCTFLADAQEAMGESEESVRTLTRAISLLSEEEPEKALDLYRRILQIAPDTLDIRVQYGEHLLKIGKRAEAAANARKMAELYASRGDSGMARSLYDKADQIEPEKPEVLRSLIRQHAGNPSIQYMDYVRYGDALNEAGDIDGALAAYRQARAIDDSKISLIQKCIDAITQIAPEHEALPDYIALADRYMAADDPRRAQQLYEHVLRMDPSNTTARNGKALAMRKRQA